MAPSEGKLEELDEKTMDAIVKYVSNIRSGKVQGSEKVALATVDLLEQIISESESANALSLCNTVRAAGRHITQALPTELVAANMVRRVLRAIRDEQRAHANQSAEGAGESLQRLVLAAPCRRATLGPAARDLREPIRDHISEIRAELDSSWSSICAQAARLVQGGELVVAGGAGALLERFLRAAGRGRRVLLAEGQDVAESHAMAARLAGAGVPVTLVALAAVPALMPRVSKVIIGAEAALAGGAALAPAGALLLTTAAAHRAVEVLVLAPLYALSPLHACARRRLAAHAPAPAAHALPYMSAESAAVRVEAPRHDLLPPDHITLFITNLGGSSPSYIYRLLSELYDPNDYQL